jgi:hypothetical protein
LWPGRCWNLVMLRRYNRPIALVFIVVNNSISTYQLEV